MLQLFVLGVKIITVLVILYISGTYHLPLLLFVVPAWYVWLFLVSPETRKRLIATAGFILMVIGCWCETLLWHYFAMRIEMSHFSEDGRYWAGLGVASQRIGIVLTFGGLLMLAYADYLRPSKLKKIATISGGEDTDENQVWPPAPKHPQ